MEQAGKPSITFTLLIFFGIAIMIAGLVATLLGFGQAAPFSFKVNDVEVHTGSCGLSLMSIGALYTGFIATRLPAGVSVFSVRPPTVLERFQAAAPGLIIAGVLLAAVAAVRIAHGG